MSHSPSIWFNGALQFVEDVRISPFDHGLTVGNGVFETLLAPMGEPFAFSRHHTRLGKSAAVLGLSVPDGEALRGAVGEVLKANGLEGAPARVRITVTGGVAPLGSGRGDASPSVLVAAAAAPVYGQMEKVLIVPFTRNETGALVGVKSTSYAENVMGLDLARKAGAGEAIFGNTHHQLCEGSGSNVFLVLDDHLVTPPLSSGCLPGVTRALVLELCAREGIEVERKPVPASALVGAEEAFLTSTTRWVQPIRAVDGVEIGDGPGKLTMKLRELLLAWAAREIDP